MTRNHFDEAAVLLEQGLAGLDPSDDPVTYAGLAAGYARTRMIRFQAEEGAAWAERALAAAGPARAVEVIAEAMNTRGVCLQGLGRLDEGIALIRASVELAAAHHLSAAELRARFNLAGRLYADDPVGARDVLRTGVEVARRTGRRDWLLLLAGFLSGHLMIQLDYDGALDVLAQMEEDDLPPLTRATIIADRAAMAAYRGDRTAWPRGIVEARRLVAGQSNTQTEWAWAVQGAFVALAEGRLDDAAREASAAGGNFANWGAVARTRAAVRARDLQATLAGLELPALQEAQGAVFDMERAGLAASVLALEGKRDAAAARYQEALGIGRRIGESRGVADVALDAVILLGPDHPETAGFAVEARTAWERAGARAQLDRLHEALAAKPSCVPIGETNEPGVLR
jgi:hypothetical protein